MRDEGLRSGLLRDPSGRVCDEIWAIIGKVLLDASAVLLSVRYSDTISAEASCLMAKGVDGFAGWFPMLQEILLDTPLFYFEHAIYFFLKSIFSPYLRTTDLKTTFLSLMRVGRKLGATRQQSTISIFRVHLFIGI